MKIVLDTNCLMVALPVRSRYYWIWQAFREKEFTLCYSTEILQEYHEILSRHYPLQFVNDVITELLHSANIKQVTPYYKWDLITSDPDDNKFVDCALNSGAEYLVTNDHHFNILKTIPFPPINVIDIESFKTIFFNH